MNRQKSIAVFAVIAAIAMTSIGLTASSNTSFMMISPASQTPELVGMLGHIEYTVRDSNNYVTSYMQGDNVVVDAGKDCAGSLIFGAAQAGSCDTAVNSKFTYVAIGNSTGGFTGQSTQDVLHMNTTRADDGQDGNTESCYATGASGEGGEMARKLVTPSITTAANEAVTGTIVTLDTSGNAFEFDANNATTVQQSAIFNGAVDSAKTGEPQGGSCLTSGGPAGTQDDWSMFSIQDLNSGSGITVTDGDSLSVKWTITIG